jgi:hypothetical protein
MKPREIDVSDKQDVTHALEAFEAFEAGKQAALSGKQATDNPHPTTSEEY